MMSSNFEGRWVMPEATELIQGYLGGAVLRVTCRQKHLVLENDSLLLTGERLKRKSGREGNQKVTEYKLYTSHWYLSFQAYYRPKSCPLPITATWEDLCPQSLRKY